MHTYRAHIFRTDSIKIWQYFSKLWGISTPKEAKAIIEKQKQKLTKEPNNLEEQAISQVGLDVYEKFIKGYTQKQWGRELHTNAF